MRQKHRFLLYAFSRSFLEEGSADLSLGQRADAIESESNERSFKEGEKTGLAMAELKATALAKLLEKVIKELTSLISDGESGAGR